MTINITGTGSALPEKVNRNPEHAAFKSNATALDAPIKS